MYGLVRYRLTTPLRALENVESIKYLGVTITNDLEWNTHISNVCTKANRTLVFLRRNLYSCPPDVKEAAYKGLVRPVLEYGIKIELRSFKSSEHINERNDGSYHGFGY